MACTTTSILILLSILVPLFSLPCRCRAFELMNWSCNNGTSYAANTTYHSNVRAVLASLSASAPNSTNGFARASAGGGRPDTVWGLALCRADTDDAGCASCLALVPAVAFNECRGVRDVTVFYDRCLLRYSYVDFMARPDNTEVQMASPSQERITINAGRFDALVAGIVDALSDWAAFNSTSSCRKEEKARRKCSDSGCIRPWCCSHPPVRAHHLPLFVRTAPTEMYADAPSARSYIVLGEGAEVRKMLEH